MIQTARSALWQRTLWSRGEQGAIFALETATGTKRWSWQAEGEILRYWSTIGNGTLYIATTHALYALRSYVSQSASPAPGRPAKAKVRDAVAGRQRRASARKRRR